MPFPCEVGVLVLCIYHVCNSLDLSIYVAHFFGDISWLFESGEDMFLSGDSDGAK